ncbi:peroxin [Paecilomyces lecythidis]|uniref:Peroxin n=1 Tax=Paecilomyces lecythidis TaxID=3004212 RepID=A0ABR3XM30_9EURO
MIGATKRWFRRNRKGLAIGFGVIGAGYLAGQYVLSKIAEARERMSSDRIAKENLRRRFEQNQTDCTFTVLALLPTATENILEALPVEELTQELQRKRAERLARIGGDATGSEFSSATPSTTEDDGRSLSSFQSESFLHTSQMDGDGQRPKRSKTQLWNEVKISSITRAFTLIYTLSLLTLLTRIQLNLLGRRNYLSSVVSLATPPANAETISLEDHDDGVGQMFGNDYETNRRYLTFSWWLLHRGWKDLMEKVHAAVKETFGPVNPREDITIGKLSELTLQVRKKIEGATEEERRSKNWLPYLLPPREEEDTVLQESGVIASAPSSPQTAATLRHLLDETSDLIESPSFTHILTLLNNEGFSTLVDQNCASQAFKVSATPDSPKPAVQNFSSSATIIPAPSPSAPKAKLATVLAVMTRQAHVIGNGTNPPNEYLVAMEQGVRELEAFAAVVYSSNFDLQMPDSGLSSALLATGATSSGATSSPPHLGAQNGDGKTSDLGVSSLVDLSQVVASEAASRSEQETQGPSSAMPSGTVVDPAFEKVWGKAMEETPSNGSS